MKAKGEKKMKTAFECEELLARVNNITNNIEILTEQVAMLKSSLESTAQGTFNLPIVNKLTYIDNNIKYIITDIEAIDVAVYESPHYGK